MEVLKDLAMEILHKILGQISKGVNVLGGGLERYNELLHIFKRVSYFLENMPYHFDFKEGFQLLKQRISWQSSIAVSISVTDNQTFTI